MCVLVGEKNNLMSKNKKPEYGNTTPDVQISANSGLLATSGQVDSQTFDLAMRELEGIVAQMEGGQMPLESMLQAYQRGAQLVATCKQKLSAVEQQVKVLDGEVLHVFETDHIAPAAGSRG